MSANLSNFGGSAFPWQVTITDGSFDPINGRQLKGENAIHVSPGMTLRDYFAAKAMAQLIAHKEAVMAIHPDLRDSAVDVEGCVAKAAYPQADAMLRAREEVAQ